MNQYENKTAVITGGASGIGLALAQLFGQKGMNVVLADIQEDALKKAVSWFEERQIQVLGVKTNTAIKASVENLCKEAHDRFGKVHLLCNNAGVASLSNADKPVWETPESDWDWVMGVNFYGVLYGLQAFLPKMLEHGEEGAVVNTASLAGILPAGGTYGVSKHGVVSLSESLQRDLKTRGAKIHAAVLCPGFVQTQIMEAERNRPEPAQGGAPSMAAMMAKMTISKGMLPDDIAQIVFDSIESKSFYILPHKNWDEFVQERFNTILNRGDVAETGLERIVARMQKGDQF